LTQELDPPRVFEVVAARSGISCVVGEDDTIAHALTELGIPLRLGCQGGGCGTCVQQVLEGVPEHHDVYLTEAERRAGKFLVCCGRSLSGRIVIDV
jgi:vanillate monooxygenase ferredoxin subunit